MTVVVAAIVGFLTGRMLWLAMRTSFHRPPFLRDNYQGVNLPTAAGIVLVFTLLVVEGLRAVVAGIGIGDEPGLTADRSAMLLAVASFSLFGLLDDLAGTTNRRGFAGHLKALASGELTSGALKLLGGAASALVVASLIVHDGFGSLVMSAAIIALSANLFNLFDLRPGRTTKVAVATFVVLALAASFAVDLVPLAIVIGAAAALVLDDLHERLMLGDTGANALGAAIGVGLVSQVSGTGRVVTLGVLLALNLISEVVSFSNVIARVAPLRVLDELGRRRPPTVDLRDRTPSEGTSPRRRSETIVERAQPVPTGTTTRATVGGAHEDGFIRSHNAEQQRFSESDDDSFPFKEGPR